MVEEKQYPSLFLPESKINLANFLTEIVICNYLNWQKIPRPTSPFWRKDIPKTKELEALSDRYQIELTAITKLLKVYEPAILAKFFAEKNIAVVQMLTKPKAQAFMYDLFHFAIKQMKEDRKQDYVFEEQIIQKYTPSTFYKKQNILL